MIKRFNASSWPGVKPPSAAPAGVWAILTMVLIAAAIIGLGIGMGALLRGGRLPDKRLHMACDRVVETLLLTHDPVELERARILVNMLNCGLEERIDDWPPARIGGLAR